VSEFPDFPPAVIDPADIWTYPTRELTQAQFPFWSAIITQTQGSVTVPHDAAAYVDIQPPAGETWLLWIDWFLYHTTPGYVLSVTYMDYDGVTRRFQRGRRRDPTTNYDYGHFAYTEGLGVMKVLTNSLYGSLYSYHNTGVDQTTYYGYSGFKLSKPLWSPKHLSNPNLSPKPWKRRLTRALPSEVSVLEPYACEVYDEEVGGYIPVIMLEEDTPLAVDPTTNFPVERLTVHVTPEKLIDILNQRDDPTLRPNIVLEAPQRYRGLKMRELKASEFEEVTGYRKYLDRWRSEGINI